MKHLLALLILCSLPLLNCFAQVTSWNEAYYNRFDHGNYTAFTRFADTINPEYFDHALLNAAVFFETNRQRVKYGCKPLKYHPKLEVSAQGHSKDMVEFNFFSHTSRVPRKTSVSDRVKNAGLNENYVGENIFDHYILDFDGISYYPPSQYGFFKSAATGERIPFFTYQGLAEALVVGWMNSAGHRENILRPEFTHMGMGNALYYKGQDIDRIPSVKSTQNFANIKPLSVFAQKPVRTSYGQPAYSTSEGRKTALAQKPVQLSISAGVAGVFKSVDNLAQGDGFYQAALYFGWLKGQKGYGQNFYGLFTTLDFDQNNAFAIEAGSIVRRFWRFSAGARCEPSLSKPWAEQQWMPSLTTGVRINIASLFFDMNLNVFQNSHKQPDGRLIAAVGICF